MPKNNYVNNKVHPIKVSQIQEANCQQIKKLVLARTYLRLKIFRNVPVVTVTKNRKRCW
jgi:hypothetical protein